MGWDATDWKMHWSRGRKITWCGKTLKGVIKFHSKVYYTGKQGVQCSKKGRKKIGRYDLLYRQAWKRHEQRQWSRSIWELRFVPQGMEEEDSDFMFLYWIVLLPWWGVFWSEVCDKKFSSLVDGLLTCCILVFIFKIFFVVFFLLKIKLICYHTQDDMFWWT